jgi:translocation and assembly module TamB
MRRRYRVLAWILAALVALPLLLAGAVFVAANTAPGRGIIQRLTAQLTHGQVQLIGLSGHFPDDLALTRLELRDPQGLWLAIDGLKLQWTPSRLLSWRAQGALLAADEVDIQRPPAYPRKPKTTQRHFHWPRVEIDRLEVARLDLGAPLAGNAVALEVHGRGHWDSLRHTEVQLDARRLDEVPSTYHVGARFNAREIAAQVDLEEGEGGPLAHLVRLPDIGAVAIHLNLAGPPEAVVSRLSVHAGRLDAHAEGTLDADTGVARLEVSLDAEAMSPRAGIAWQRLHLSGLWQGPPKAPATTAELAASGVELPGVQLPSLSAHLQGQGGALTLDARTLGLVLPGRVGAMFAASPVAAHAVMHLDQPGRPADVTLSHALVNASGHWSGGARDGTANLTGSITDLKPFAAIAALQLTGRGTVTAQYHTRAQSRDLDVSSALEITGGQAPLAALLAGKCTLSADMSFDPQGFAIRHAQLQSNRALAAVQGRIDEGTLSLAWRAALIDLSPLAPRLAGIANGHGEISGKAPHLTASADVDGQLALGGTPMGPLHLKLGVRDLAQRPVGDLALTGTLEQAPVDVELSLQSRGDGTLEARVERAAWKSARASGQVHWPGGSGAPQGQLEVAIEHLDDLEPLIGHPLQGSFLTRLDFDAGAAGGRARVHVEAHGAGVAEQQVQTVRITGDINGIRTQPALALRVTARTAVAGVPVALHAQLQGPIDAIGLELHADSQGEPNTTAQLEAGGTIDGRQRTLRLSALELKYREQTARLSEPAVLAFGDGVSLDRLRLAVGGSTWQLQGRLAPSADLHASVHNLTTALLQPWLPGVQSDGGVDVDLDLQGSFTQPTGKLRIKGHDLRARSGSVRGLPAGNITLTAQLQQTVAQVELKADAGERLKLQASGQAPLSRNAPMSLKIGGTFDLLLINPILEASGQRVHGQATLDASIAGTPAAPEAQGSLEIHGVDVKDYPRGLHLTEIEGRLVASGDRIELQQLTANAAPGTISVSGSLGLGAGYPLSLKLEAHNAKPLASDLVTANLDMDLTVVGPLHELSAAGKLHINRADLNIPNALPPSVAVLDVRRPGEQPPPTRKSTIIVKLDIGVEAPRQVFVRGRGLQSELGGSLHIGGTSEEPIVSGGFDMRNGTISLAGSTLTFASGRVSFNGTGLKKKIDPTLDFTATSVSNGVTYTLNVGGYADAPVITLSSTPEQPQDQILARLLFGADPSQLSALQIAQIAAALATMSGVGGGLNPLTAVQRALGLDRLAISGNTTSTPTAVGPSAQGTSTGATIEAGRYVSSRVYVGAKQFTTGTTQAQVQIDLTKSLKVQAAIGTGGATVQGVTPQNDPGSSLGLSYQFEY